MQKRVDIGIHAPLSFFILTQLTTTSDAVAEEANHLIVNGSTVGAPGSCFSCLGCCRSRVFCSSG